MKECCCSREEGQANDIPATLVVKYYSIVMRRFYISYKQVKMTYLLPRAHAVFCGRFIITVN